jgi:hypothetical protein
VYTGRRGLLAGDQPQVDDDGGAAGADRALLQDGGSISFGGGSRRGTNSGRSANRNGRSGSGSGSRSGMSLTCTACTGGRNMKLRSMPDGTQQCGEWSRVRLLLSLPFGSVLWRRMPLLESSKP